MLISNSEVNTFLTCERKHFYSFRKALKPGTYGKALTRGIVGHEALEEYYIAKKHGGDKAYCITAMDIQLTEAKAKYPEFISEIEQLAKVLYRYVENYWDEPWHILEVESLHSTLLDNSTVKYGMRLDLLVEVTAGRDKGQIAIVDHKFVYDFFTDREKKMNAQLAKYTNTLRHNGIDVRKGILNQIRYRHLKSPKSDMIFRRDSIVTTDLEQTHFMEEFAKAAHRVQGLQQLPEDEHKKATLMHLDKTSCGMCSFQPLCSLYLQGLDERNTEVALYKHNDYVDNYRRAINEGSN